MVNYLRDHFIMIRIQLKGLVRMVNYRDHFTIFRTQLKGLVGMVNCLCDRFTMLRIQLKGLVKDGELPARPLHHF